MNSPPPTTDLATHPAGPETAPEATAFSADLRSAVVLLERIVADRTLLARIPTADQRRLLQAAGQVYAPDAASRRQLVRATARRRKAERVAREESVRESTGIRTLRRQPVFTSPNVFPPVAPRHSPRGRARSRRAREPIEPQHCYVCKPHYTDAASLLRPALSRRAPNSTSPSAPSSPTCAARWRC